MKEIGLLLLEIISNVVNQRPMAKETADKVVMNLDKLLVFAKAHGVENILYYAVLDMNLESDIFNELKQINKKCILKEATQEMEKESISLEFCLQKIKHIFLKGSVIKYLYPSVDMRQMADLDILVEHKSRKIVKETLLNLGYSLISYNDSHHDVYYKQPLMNIEVHYHTINNSYDILRYAKDSQNYSLNMNDEDFYVFMIYHMHKHYNNGGTGIRSLLDLYLYYQKYCDNLNFEVINQELTNLSLKQYADEMLEIALMCFGDKNIVMNEKIIYILKSGTYGRLDHVIAGKLVNTSKTKYLLKRIFPSVSTMKQIFPVLKKCILLLPFCYIIRLLRGIFKINTKQAELKTLKELTKNEIEEIEQIKKVN